ELAHSRAHERNGDQLSADAFAASVRDEKQSEPTRNLVAPQNSERMADRPDVPAPSRRGVHHAEQFVRERHVAPQELFDLGVLGIRVADQSEKTERQEMLDGQIPSRQRLRCREAVPLEKLEAEL